jgi:hypothetical protein
VWLGPRQPWPPPGCPLPSPICTSKVLGQSFPRTPAPPNLPRGLATPLLSASARRAARARRQDVGGHQRGPEARRVHTRQGGARQGDGRRDHHRRRVPRDHPQGRPADARGPAGGRAGGRRGARRRRRGCGGGRGGAGGAVQAQGPGGVPERARPLRAWLWVPPGPWDGVATAAAPPTCGAPACSREETLSTPLVGACANRPDALPFSLSPQTRPPGHHLGRVPSAQQHQRSLRWRAQHQAGAGAGDGGAEGEARGA